MFAKVQKWGNSQGVRLTRQLLEEAHLSPGDTVDVSVRDGLIIVSPMQRVRGRYCLKDLVAQQKKPCKSKEAAWGGPVGKEVW